MPKFLAKPLRGLVVPPHTPFHADGSLNLEAVEKQASHFLRSRIDAVFIGGSTGEGSSLSLDERLALTRRWAEVTRGTTLRVIVHVGANALADARMLAHQAEAEGVAGIAAMSPSYFKPRSVDVLVACMAEIATAAVTTPFYFYDIPALTQVNFPMTEFLERAHLRIPTLAGIKFTNSDLASYQSCLRIHAGIWDLPWGIDQHFLGALAVGAQGAVGSSYNYAAPLYHNLIARFKAGDIAAAQEAQYRGVCLLRIMHGHGAIGAAKATMKMLGVDVGQVRLPNESLGEEQQSRLRLDLEKLGFFDWIR